MHIQELCLKRELLTLSIFYQERAFLFRILMPSHYMQLETYIILLGSKRIWTCVACVSSTPLNVWRWPQSLVQKLSQLNREDRLYLVLKIENNCLRLSLIR